MIIAVTESGINASQSGQDAMLASAVNALLGSGDQFTPQQAAQAVAQALNVSQDQSEAFVQDLFDKGYLDMVQGQETPASIGVPGMAPPPQRLQPSGGLNQVPVPGQNVPSVVPGQSGMGLDGVQQRFQSLTTYRGPKA